MISLNQEQHIHDIAAIIIHSKNNLDVMEAGLIRYAIKNSYSFCGSRLNAALKYEYIRIIIDSLPSHIYNHHRITNMLHNFYSSSQEIEIHNDTWFQTLPGSSLGHYSRLLAMQENLNKLRNSHADDHKASSLLHRLVDYCSQSHTIFKMYCRNSLIKHGVIQTDHELPLQIIQQAFSRNSSKPILSENAHANLILASVLHDSKHNYYTQSAKHVMLSSYGDLSKNGNILLKKSIDSTSNTTTQFLLSTIQSTILNPSHSNGARTAFEYFLSNESAQNLFTDATSNSLRLMHERDLLILNHSDSSEYTSGRNMSAL